MNFKADIRCLNNIQIVQKHILSGDCYLLNTDNYYDLKNEIADKFKIRTNEIYMVGSAFLGFSIKEDRRFLHFSDTSDIDIGMVSSPLFDQIWEKVFMYEYNKNYWPKQGTFKKYLFQGWIRPDLLPSSPSLFDLTNNWFDFFRKLSSTGKYGNFQIKAGLYKSLFFLEHYQSICVRECRQMLKESPDENNSN